MTLLGRERLRVGGRWRTPAEIARARRRANLASSIRAALCRLKARVAKAAS